MKNKELAKRGINPLLTANVKPVNSLSIRRMMTKRIYDQVQNMQLDEMQSLFIKYFKEICPIKDNGSIFFGDLDRPRTTYGTKMRLI